MERGQQVAHAALAGVVLFAMFWAMSGWTLGSAAVFALYLLFLFG